MAGYSNETKESLTRVFGEMTIEEMQRLIEEIIDQRLSSQPMDSAVLRAISRKLDILKLNG